MLFVVEYYDPLPRIKRQYLLRYWGVDEKTVGGNGFVEMVDVKAKKLFLKKSPAPMELDPRDLVIGSRVCCLNYYHSSHLYLFVNSLFFLCIANIDSTL